VLAELSVRERFKRMKNVEVAPGVSTTPFKPKPGC
jgi:hypothetical protein